MHLYDDEYEDDAEDHWANQRTSSSDENPDGSDLEYGDDIKCVHCGRYIHDHVDMCPYCKMWQPDEVTRSRKPLWFVVTAIILLLAFSGVLTILLITCGGRHG
jgi:hypothetical protein